MMNQRDRRLSEIQDCFENGDEDLGIRRLIDAVSDSAETILFQKMLGLLDAKDLEGQFPAIARTELIHALGQLPYTEPTGAEARTLLVVSNLKKQYKKSNFCISELSFSLRSGEVAGLVGENGNGKTTLLKLLSKDLEADAGSIEYPGNSPGLPLYRLRSRLVYIPQRVPRWFGSLTDNLHFTLSSYGIHGEENRLRAELMLARLGLRPFRQLGWNRISSGYRTRFELAKSLLRKPGLMLLDEPLSNLDIISQQTILQDLKHMSASLAHPFGLVLSSQQLYEVEKISDLVIFLKQGQAQFRYKNKSTENEADEIVFELESTASRETILNTFTDTGLQKIQFNGGVYILYFSAGTQPHSVYESIGKHKLSLSYIRNITDSSRRFFIQ